MPAERYYFDGELSSQTTIDLKDQEYHHLSHVMRTQPGDSVEVINGRGVLAVARVTQLEKKQAILTIDQISYEPKKDFQIILAQAIPRSNRLDFILEKGTELGMTHIWLFPGDHSERKQLAEHQMERAKMQLVAAMKQCGRLWLPEIAVKPNLKNWPKENGLAFYGSVAPDAPRMGIPRFDGKRVLFFIGPESGFSAHEEAYFEKMGVQGVKLHDNILRTDTAALVALTLLNASFG